MRNGYVIDTLTSVDIQKIVEIGGKVTEFYEAVLYRENSKVSPFRKVIDEVFAFRQKYKKERNKNIQFLVKVSVNSL